MHSQKSPAAMLFISVVLATSVTAFIGPRQESPQIDIREARKHVRKNVTVCGTVTTHRCPRPKRTTYLDLETPYWSGGVSVAIPAGRRQAFGARVEDQYAFRSVCASGRVEREGHRYVVIVSQPSDLRIERAPEPAPALLEPAGVRACDEGVELPQPLTRVKPEYPSGAQARQIKGVVLLDGVVRVDGSVGEVGIVHSLDAELDDEAVKAFKKWRFTPGTVSGRPVPVIVGVQLSFDLK